jgi:hypothetical protein
VFSSSDFILRISAIFRSRDAIFSFDKVRHRSEGGVRDGNPCTSVWISPREKPARFAERMSLSCPEIELSYRRHPLFRPGSGRSPMRS